MLEIIREVQLQNSNDKYLNSFEAVQKRIVPLRSLQLLHVPHPQISSKSWHTHQASQKSRPFRLVQLNSLRCQADSRACHQRKRQAKKKREDSFVPRILIIQIGLPSEFNGMHLPVRFNFVTTIKKSFSNDHWPQPYFTHGQFYVVSRVTSRNNFFILTFNA